MAVPLGGAGEVLDGAGGDRRPPGSRPDRAGSGIPRRPERLPSRGAIRARSPRGRSGTATASRPGCGPGCMLSNGLYRSGPLIHPISAIGPMIPFARVPEHDRPARELVRAGQSQPPDRLHRPGLSAARRRAPDLHLGRRLARAVPRGSSRGASRSGSSSCCARAGASTGSTPISKTTGAPWPSHRRHAPGPHLSDSLRPCRRPRHPPDPDRRRRARDRRAPRA